MLQEREISPESDDISTVSSRDNITVMTTRRSLVRSAALQRIGSQQDKWKQQVRQLLWYFWSILDNLRSRNSGHVYTINTRCSTEDSLVIILSILILLIQSDVNKPFNLIHLLKILSIWRILILLTKTSQLCRTEQSSTSPGQREGNTLLWLLSGPGCGIESEYNFIFYI